MANSVDLNQLQHSMMFNMGVQPLFRPSIQLSRINMVFSISSVVKESNCNNFYSNRS